MKYFILILCTLLMCVKHCLSDRHTILKIDESEYYKLPDLFLMDNYKKCLSQNDTFFCMGKFELRGDPTSRSYQLMQKLTATRSNFNHTEIHRAWCLGDIYDRPFTEANSSEEIFEYYVNKDIQLRYGFEAKLKKLEYCKDKFHVREYDGLDYMFVIYLVAILSINLLCSVLDILLKDKIKTPKWIQAFSLKENWKKLTSSEEENQQQFNSFNGMKAMSSILVNLAHASLGLTLAYPPDVRHIEMLVYRTSQVMFIHLTAILQTFVVLTCFLRARKTFRDGKNRKQNYRTLVKAAVDRFVRIIPLFITFVAFNATLLPHLGDGALWDKIINNEAYMCRMTFWRHVFLLQNFYPVVCLGQSWYLAMDFQLFIIATIISICLVNFNKNQLKILFGLFCASLVLLFVIIHTMELLPPLLYVDPSMIADLFIQDISFIYLYQSLWGGLPSAIVGVTVAYLYEVRFANSNIKHNRAFKLAYRLSIPAMLAYIMSAVLFIFSLTDRLSISIYATLEKPIFAIIIAVFMMGCILQVDDVLYRGIVEWRGWLVLSRLCLPSLLIHAIINKAIITQRLSPVNISDLNTIVDACAVTVLTFIACLPASLLVEYPFNELFKALTLVKSTNDNVEENRTNGCHKKDK